MNVHARRVVAVAGSNEHTLLEQQVLTLHVSNLKVVVNHGAIWVLRLGCT